MNTRSRFAFAVVAIAAGVVVTACADKLLRPPVSGSPRIQLQFSTIGAQVLAGGKRQVLVVAAAYVSSQLNAQSDSFRILAGPVVAQVTGASQEVTMNVDLTSCLADPTRKGSQTGCSLYYGVWLRDSTGVVTDTSDFNKFAYDYTLVGPVDVTPGKPPTLAPITLSQSRFSVFQFTGDETLRLGGSQTPQGFSGPITGSTAGLAAGAPPVLYGITNGFQVTSQCTANQNNCQTNGYVAAQLAIFQNGTWSRVSGPQGLNQFNDVAAFSPTDVYLAAPNGLYHYDGSSISPVSAVTGGNVGSLGIVTSGGSKYIIAGGPNGNTWIGNTTTWQSYPAPTNGAGVNSVCITGPTEAFAASTSNGGLYRFNGQSWTQVPATLTQPKVDLQCPAPGQAFAVALNTAVLSWNGSGWSQLPNPGRGVRIAAVSPTEIYAAGDSAGVNRNFYRWDGASWKVVATSQYTQPIQQRPWADSRGGAGYFSSVALGRIEQVTASGVHPVSYDPSIRDATMTSASNAFAVGQNMFLARWNGATWTIDPPPAGTNTTRILNGVFSDGPSNAWAVGNFATILHWNGSGWSVVSDSIKPATAQRDLYNGVWGTGGTVWIVGNSSILRCVGAAGVCAPDPVTGIDTLYGIWGSSATNAWAVGARGKILHFDGSQWTPVTSPTTSRMVRLWGSSATNVWAAGDSVVAHFDGTAWSAATSAQIFNNNPVPQGTSASFQVGLWGANPTEVYVSAPGGNMFRWDGQSWNDMASSSNQNGGRIVAISGWAGGCAIALIDGAVSGYTPTLLRGVSPTGGCLGSPMPIATPWP